MGILGPVLWFLSAVLTLSHSYTSIPIQVNSARSDHVCSTWGKFQYKTFDGDFYQFPGTCNYLLTSNCLDTVEDFNIQIRHSEAANETVVSHIMIKIVGLVIEMNKDVIMVGGETITVPYSHLGIQIQYTGVYVKVSSKLGVSLLWNADDALTVKVPPKYINRTCGLCGNMNGNSQDEFAFDEMLLTPVQFGNLQKLNGPTELCADVIPPDPKDCNGLYETCVKMLSNQAFSDCEMHLPQHQYVQACISDLCSCQNSSDPSCACDTLAEYSRQCAIAGGKPQDWRTNMCERTCPGNMKYEECGSPCADTCSNSDRTRVCEELCLDGCYCPNVQSCLSSEVRVLLKTAEVSRNRRFKPRSLRGNKDPEPFLSLENVAVLQPSSFYLIIQRFSGIQIQVQLIPVMQISVTLDPEYHGNACEATQCKTAQRSTLYPSWRRGKPRHPGLCGDFNNIQTDDFRSLSGALEGTAAAFANTWKSQSDCNDVKDSYENPCSLSVDNEQFAQQWCSQLSDSTGPFALCHAAVNPEDYEKNCMYDSCNYENSVDSVCAAHTAYVRACAAENVILVGWRGTICDCPPNMIYFDCANASRGAKGAECQKTCQTLDMECFSIQCASGCVCPHGLVLSNNGSCVLEKECPCVHNGISYYNGESIQQDCNNCTCKNHKWQCTKKECYRSCVVYGDGHFVTFDGKRFDFNGDCEYTVTQNYELQLSEGSFEVVERDIGGEVPYQIRQMGIYLVIEANNGLILMWDKKTSILIKLSPEFKVIKLSFC
ncbi:mucin-2-like [Hyperolius riggenbachi]|uniref:mucin-2-like n=1 Tax=Hyperolius riggenbachi TaxID=752182 RepID=UPI0035A37B4B